MYNTTPGNVFKNLVRGAGLTMKQIIKETGLAPKTVSAWANGKQNILVINYDKCVDAYEKLKNEQEKD